MWFDKPPRKPDWSAAIKHLQRDPVMRRIIARVGPCALSPRRDFFVVLCKSIFSQQISTKIAAILFGRFRDQFPQRRPTPQRVGKFLQSGDDEVIRTCGLSKQKRAYVLDLAKHFVDGEIPTRRFARMSDEQIVESLVRVNGIGRWTAEMFLIFVLNRPDVWPVDDLGLREAAKKAFKLAERPGAAPLREMGEKYRPWRTVATWYLWKSLSV
jgi:DNA-3-methyladenine glycosylase II